MAEKKIYWDDGTSDAMTVSPSSGGAGTHVISLQLPKNSTSSARIRKINIKTIDGKFLASHTVTQLAAPPINECEDTDPQFPVYFAHETDPTLFYACNWGEKVLQECPGGLWFNPCMGWCDLPENVMDCPEFGLSDNIDD